MKRKTEILAVICTLSLLEIVLFRNFFSLTSYPAGSDTFSFIFRIGYISEIGGFFEIWNEYSNTFNPLELKNFLSVFNLYINNPALIVKIFIIVIYFLAGFLMYLYARRSINNFPIALFASLLFVTNKWFIIKIASGHLWHVLSYTLIPLFFYLADDFVDTLRKKYIVLLSILGSFLLLLRFDPILYIVPILLLYILIKLLFKFGIKIQTIKNYFLFLGIFFFLLILLGIYQLIPMRLIETIQTSRIYSEETIYNLGFNFIYTIVGNALASNYIFTLGGIDWNNHPFLPLQYHILLMGVYPIMAFGIILFYRSERIITLVFISLVSILLASGFETPSDDIYRLLYYNVPLMNFVTVPNRFIIIAIFVFSILSAQFIYEIKKGYPQLRGWYLVSALILLLIPNVLVNSYIFENGFMTWQPMREEISPHYYLRNADNESSRIITVPYIYENMYTPGGWREHDLGKYSGMYSFKTPLYQPLSSKSGFVDFIQSTKLIIKNNKSQNLPKILGIFNVKYILLQSYPSNSPDEVFGRTYNYQQHEFFEHQSGIDIVFIGERSNYSLKVIDDSIKTLSTMKIPQYEELVVSRSPKVYKNQYYQKWIFSPSNNIVVVGGLETFAKFAEFENLDFGDNNLIFANNVKENMDIQTLSKQLNMTDYIAFINTDSTDLAMLLTNATWIKVNALGTTSTNWNEDDWPIFEGYFTSGREVVSTQKPGAKAIYETEIHDSSTYEVWVRAFSSRRAGSLTVSMKGEHIGNVNPSTSGILGFKWFKVSDVVLEKGKYDIEIMNEKGENKLNSIVIAREGEVEASLNYVESLKNKTIYLLDKEKGWKPGSIDDNAITFENDRPTGDFNITPERESSVKSLEFQRISPSKWIAKVNSTAHYTLVFSNSYHPMWRAYVNGKEYRSIPSYYFINSFQIDETGEHEVVIEFIGQRIQNFGLMISGMAYLLCFSFLFFDWRREKGDRWAMQINNQSTDLLRRIKKGR